MPQHPNPNNKERSITVSLPTTMTMNHKIFLWKGTPGKTYIDYSITRQISDLKIKLFDFMNRPAGHTNCLKNVMYDEDVALFNNPSVLQQANETIWDFNFADDHYIKFDYYLTNHLLRQGGYIEITYTENPTARPKCMKEDLNGIYIYLNKIPMEANAPGQNSYRVNAPMFKRLILLMRQILYEDRK